MGANRGFHRDSEAEGEVNAPRHSEACPATQAICSKGLRDTAPEAPFCRHAGQQEGNEAVVYSSAASLQAMNSQPVRSSQTFITCSFNPLQALARRGWDFARAGLACPGQHQRCSPGLCLLVYTRRPSCKPALNPQDVLCAHALLEACALHVGSSNCGFCQRRSRLASSHLQRGTALHCRSLRGRACCRRQSLWDLLSAATDRYVQPAACTIPLHSPDASLRNLQEEPACFAAAVMTC